MRPVDPRLLREAPAARRFLGATTVLGLLVAAAIVVQAVSLGRIVAGVVFQHEDLAAAAPQLALFGGATAVRALLAWALESGGRLAALEVAAVLRLKVLAHLLASRPGGVRETPAGELAAVAVGGLDALDPYFGRFLPQLVLSAVVPAVIFAWVVWHDLTSAVVMALTLPLIPVFGILIGKVTEAQTLRRFGTLSLLSAYFLDTVRGLPTLRAFGRGRTQTATIAAVSDTYRRETMSTLRTGFLSAFVLELAATLSTAVIAVEIGIRLVDGHIALAPAFAVLVLAPEYYGPLRNAAAQFHAAADGLAAATAVFALLDLAPEVAVPDRPLPVPQLGGGTLRLEHLTVRYPDRTEAAVDNLSVVIHPGERIALTGPSGSGKSTLLAVLLRLVDPTGGRVIAAGVDVARLDPAGWRDQLAWLPQRPRLAPGTLREALVDGRAVSDERLWIALEQADALPVVAGLSGGLAAVLGERTQLSAGEVRRLALARALLVPKPLVLLDEPTTYLDARSGEAIVRALVALPREATLVFATHDDRLLAIADRVLHLDSVNRPELAVAEWVA